METIEELRASVHRDPRHAAEVATALATAARASGDAGGLSRALALRGRARRSLGEIDLAEADLRHALEAATAAPPADQDELAADAHLGLAGVLSFAGRAEEAFDHLDLADRLGSDRVRAYAALQRAVVEQRLGRLARALAGYQAALPVLRRLPARLDVAMVLLNLGVIQTQTGECDAAVADLTEARDLFAQEDHAFGVAQADHGLGWAHARRGDLPAALSLLDRAAERFHRLGHLALEVDVDRTEVLLAAGLHGQAQDLATATARKLAAAGNHSQAAETWLLCARSSLLAGDRAGARQFAARARALFAEQSAAGWEGAARLELHLCGERPASAAALGGLADELAALGNARGAAVALALACVAACDAGDRAGATAFAAQCARSAYRLGIFEVRMLATYAQARCALAGGDLPGATRLVRTGLAGLQQHRRTFAATDARAAVAVHAAQLTALGLRMALASGSPGAVLEWMELARAGPGQYRSGRPPSDPALAAELARLRAVAAQVREAEAGHQDTTDLLHTQRDLEQAIHRRQLRTAAGDRPADAAPAGLVATLPQLRSALAGESLVAIVEIDGRLVAVRVGGPAAELVDLGPAAGVYRAASTLAAVLRSFVTARPARRPRTPPAATSDPNAPALAAPEVPTSPPPGLYRLGDQPGYRDRIERLGRAVAGLDAVLGGLCAGAKDEPLVLVVPAALHNVAWSLLPSVAGRPVVVAPSATWWWQARCSQPPASLPGFQPAGPPGTPPAGLGQLAAMPLVVAGPRLATALPEAAGVAACYPGAAPLSGAAATSTAVLARLALAPAAHLACHSQIRPDNPLWSSLELVDGPLCGYDLERLPRTPPLVVLSGCDTAVGVRTGDELLGLATALLRRGTRTLVAAVCALPDTAATRDTMIALHRRLAAGMSAPAALAELTAGGVRDTASLSAASLGCFGIH